ncbi:polyisoprenoid-binding protein YceI [Halomonas fontilapidosi]|uniref:Polyisoprenoid-binding protein YceI n=1 Tax=Halomonas fontilapidosi TaxID=616675 RepID=A0A7W5GXV8_9GAMM|nr:YceI family protein [Halomonas fontilapidosi]MBB3182824.1 polyisoprenoid-binding protein YceI [Halomonas fontilapidosi]
MFKKTAIATALGATALMGVSQAQAADYVIDTDGQHAFVQFKVSHLGYSYILGSLEDFSGSFSYDPDNLEASSVNIDVEVASLNSNHAERDKHIKSDDFLDVAQYPTATFTSSDFSPTGDDAGVLTGELTMHGETNEIEMQVTLVGEGEDPWGGYRAGFEGSTLLTLADYGIDMSDFPEVMHDVELYVTFEGVRQ